MELSIATLLSQFSEDKLVAGKVLEKKLGCQDIEGIEKLQIALDVLEKLGILVKERGKYRRIPQEGMVEAKLRCSSKGFCFAIQNDEEAEDIYVQKAHLSNAWNGDRVLVKIIKEGNRRRSPEGEVKLILERSNPTLLARIVAQEGQFKAIPLDDRLLFELVLKENGQNLNEAIDHLVHVMVLRYPLGQHPPIAKVTRVLGSDAEAAADTDIVCCKHDLPQEFTPTAIAAATELKAEMEENRKDLRQLFTVTLQDSTNNPSLIDNAFSLEKTPTGDWQVGVHISDIAHYIPWDSPLDKEGKKRTSAINLGDGILLPLFPDALKDCCSLELGVERMTISVLITITPQGKIEEFVIEPSLIQVNHHLSYQQAEAILNNRESAQSSEVTKLLTDLFYTVCPLIKAQRIQRGGFDITLNDYHSLFKDEGRMGVVVFSPMVPIRSLLTEVLVLTNKLIAEHLHALEVPLVYCTQGDPDWSELEDVLKLGWNLGLKLKLDSSEESSKSTDFQYWLQEFTKATEVVKPSHFQHWLLEFSKTPAGTVLNYLIYHALKVIKYSTKPGAHFGLAYEDSYTHGVSPGYRYVDLVVQRVLKTVFKEGRDRRHTRTKMGVNLHSSTSHGNINWNVLPTETQEELEERLTSLISYLNDREKQAEDAERDLQGLKKAEKMKERTGQIFQGLITGVQSYGFFVQIEDLMVEGLVHVSSLKDDWYEYRARHSCLIGRKNRTAYRLGDQVEVEVKSVDYYRQQIDLVTVSEGTRVTNEELDEE